MKKLQLSSLPSSIKESTMREKSRLTLNIQNSSIDHIALS